MGFIFSSHAVLHPTFEDLIFELATITDEKRLASKISELVEGLPLPTDFPPPQIQRARRIDSPAEIRSLADTWKNDLADTITEINAGTYALYLWEDDYFSALCSVTKCERLGWFLNHVNGPHNTDLDPEQRAAIRSAFCQAGFPHIHTVAAIAAISRSAGIWNDRASQRGGI